MCGKIVEKFLCGTRLCQCITKQPDGLSIRYTIFQSKPEETHETHTIIDLIFYLIITQIVDSLQNQNFEHQETVIWRTPACTFGLFLQNSIQSGAKPLLIDGFVQSNKRISQFIQFFQSVFFVKKSKLHHRLLLCC